MAFRSNGRREEEGMERKEGDQERLGIFTTENAEAQR